MPERRLRNSTLKLAGISTITFDMWDTIVRRDCHPEEIKASTCLLLQDLLGSDLKEKFEDHLVLLRERNDVEAEIASENRAKGLDDEYEIRDVLGRLAARASNDEMHQDRLTSLVETLARHERDTEVMSTRVDTKLAEILEETHGMRRFVISDFYMPSRDLAHILARKGVLDQFEEIVSSCEVKLNKKSGRLFEHVRVTRAIEPNKWLHVGDNSHADVAMPRSLNIRAHRHYIIPEETRRKQFADSFSHRPFGAEHVRNALELARDNARRAPSSRVEQEGASLGPTFAAWALRLISSAQRLGVKCILCTGSGAKLQKTLLDIARQSLTEIRHVNAIAVPLSREALKFIGKSDLSTGDFATAWNRDGKRTPRELLDTIGVDGKRFNSLIEAHALELDTPISSLHAPAFANFLSDTQFGDYLRHAEAMQVRDLRSYLEAFGFPDGSVAIVSQLFGCDQLTIGFASAFPNIALESALLLPDFSSSTPDASVSADDTQDPLEPFANVLEFLFSSPGENVTGLHLSPGDGHIHPMHAPSAAAARESETRAAFHDGVRAGFAETFPLVLRRALSCDEARQLSGAPLRALLSQPAPELARAWLEFCAHSDAIETEIGHTGQLLHKLQASGWPVERVKHI